MPRPERPATVHAIHLEAIPSMKRSLTRLAPLAGLLAALLGTSAPAAAQLCPDPTDTFYKNDSLPDVPGGTPLAFSLIPGLCEGEAIGSVFDVAPGSMPLQVTQVSVGFGDQFGTGGFSAAVNLEIYDGVTFDVTGTPILGPKVFDLANDVGNLLQVTSTAINVLDITNFNVSVDNPNENYVVAFRMEINPNGSCAGGYNANFITDNSSIPGFTCDPAVTTPQRNLIDIIGQGWRDVTLATVMGFPLCPIFISGNWVVRACTAASFNPLNVTVLGSPVMPGGFVNLTFNAPGHGGQLYVAAASGGTSPGIPTPSGVIPLNFDVIFNISLNNPAQFVNFVGVISSTTEDAPGLVLVPADPTLSGLSFHVAFVAVPGGGALWGISSPSQIDIQ